MSLTSVDHGIAVVLTITIPRLDATTMHQICEMAHAELRDDRAVYLIDMSNVMFIDSCGIGALVSLMRTFGRTRRLELCGLTPPVRKVFRLTKLDTVFALHSNAAAALHAHSGLAHRAAG